MTVGREYRSQIRSVRSPLAGTTHVRLTKRLAEAINGFDLSKCRVGDILTVTLRDGQMLIAEGWAVPCAAELPRAQAADAGGDAPVSVRRRLRSTRGRRTRKRRQYVRTHPPPPAPREWAVAAAHPVNALLVGSAEVTHKCLRALRPQLRAPIVTVHPGGPLVLPAVPDVGTIILHDVDTLAPADQQRLVEWTEAAYRRTYVISTSRTELVRNIADGTFLATLYYRLNMLYFRAGRTASGRQRVKNPG